MCKLLHIPRGPLSLQKISLDCRGIRSTAHELKPVCAWLTVDRGTAVYGRRRLRRKYTTSREFKHRGRIPIHTFSDLVPYAIAKADWTHSDPNCLSSLGWNGGNLPAQADRLGQPVKDFAEVANIRDSLRGAEVEF